MHHRGDLNRGLPDDDIFQHIAIRAHYTNLESVVLNVTFESRILRTRNYTNGPIVPESVLCASATFDYTVIEEVQIGEVHWSRVRC